MIFNILVCCSIHFHANAQQINNLYYCNENSNIREIFVLSPKQFIGWELQNGKNQLILFNENRLMADSLQLGNSEHFFLQHFSALNDTLCYVQTLNSAAIYSTNKNRFKLLKQFETMAKNGNYPFFHTPDGLILYEHPLKPKKGILDYTFFYEKDPFKDEISDFEEKNSFAGSGKLRSHFYYDQKKENIYLPVEKASGLLIINTKNSKTQWVEWPKTESNNENWYPYFDYLQDRLYLVLIRKKGTHQLYWVDRKTFTPTFLKEISILPNAILDSKIHSIQSEKIKGKTISCHYLIPLFDNFDNKNMQLLNEIQIEQNDR